MRKLRRVRIFLRKVHAIIAQFCMLYKINHSAQFSAYSMREARVFSRIFHAYVQTFSLRYVLSTKVTSDTCMLNGTYMRNYAHKYTPP